MNTRDVMSIGAGFLAGIAGIFSRMLHVCNTDIHITKCKINCLYTVYRAHTQLFQPQFNIMFFTIYKLFKLTMQLS